MVRYEVVPEFQISVVIPTLNEEMNIEECLLSITNQTIPCEIVVVDCNSFDRTVEIAGKYADKVLVVDPKGSKGVKISIQRQTATLQAKGSIIVSADADTVYPNHWLATLTAPFSDPKVVVVGGPLLPLNYTPLTKGYTDGLNVLSRTFHLFLGSNMAFRKDAFLRVSGYRPYGRSQDWKLSQKLKSLGKSVYESSAYAWTDVPIDRQIEFCGIVGSISASAIGMGAKNNYLLGSGIGFLGTEVSTLILEEPLLMLPIHHSHVAAVGALATLAMRTKMSTPLYEGLFGLFNGIWMHHLLTEDIFNPQAIGISGALWAGINLIALTL